MTNDRFLVADSAMFELVARIVRGDVEPDAVTHVELTSAVAMMFGSDVGDNELFARVEKVGGRVARMLAFVRCFASRSGAPWFATLLLRKYPLHARAAGGYATHTRAAFALAMGVLRELGALLGEGLAGRLAGDGHRFTLAKVALEAEHRAGDALVDAENLARLAGELSDALAPHLRLVRDRLANKPREVCNLDGSAPLWLDEELATYLDELAEKAPDQETRDSIKETARFVRGNDSHRGRPIEWLSPWRIDPDNHASPVPPALKVLARAVWRVEVRPKIDAERFHRFRIEYVRQGRDDYAKVTKAGAAFSWAMGSPTERVVEIKSERYAFAEGASVRKLVPRGVTLLPKEYASRPHTMQLPLGLEELDEPAPLALSVAQSTRPQLLSMHAGKLAVLALAEPNIRDGRIVRATLGELADLLYPDDPRNRARQYRYIAKALRELRDLLAFLSDNRAVQIFDVSQIVEPDKATAETPVDITLGALFRAYAVPDKSSPMRGAFLVNLSALMRLDNKRPQLFRHAVRIAAIWNAAGDPAKHGEFDAERVPWFTLDELAALANALPPSAVDRIAAVRGKRALKPSHRVGIAEARKAVREDLEDLEGRKMVVWDRRGRDKWRPLPPESYKEAWHKFRKGGGRRSD